MTNNNGAERVVSVSRLQKWPNEWSILTTQRSHYRKRFVPQDASVVAGGQLLTAGFKWATQITLTSCEARGRQNNPFPTDRQPVALSMVLTHCVAPECRQQEIVWWVLCVLRGGGGGQRLTISTLPLRECFQGNGERLKLRWLLEMEKLHIPTWRRRVSALFKTSDEWWISLQYCQFRHLYYFCY